MKNVYTKNNKITILLALCFLLVGFGPIGPDHNEKWPLNPTEKELKFCSELEWSSRGEGILVDCSYFNGEFRVNVPKTFKFQRWAEAPLYVFSASSIIIIQQKMPNKYKSILVTYDFNAGRQLLIGFNDLYACTYNFTRNLDKNYYANCIGTKSYRYLGN